MSNFTLSTQNELYCKAEGSGKFFAKKGSMVADLGKFNYSKRLLGTNDGNVVGQVFNHLARRFTGENLEIMEVSGQGSVFLADEASHISIITLEQQGGAFNSICVESEDLLAFTEQCHYGVTIIGQGVVSQKGLFTSKLTYNGQGAQVAVKTKGNPLVLRVEGQAVTVDPDAVVAWTGANPKINFNVNWKTFIGQTSGESYFFDFTEPGQIIIVQPYERESGISLRDTNRPDYQSSPLQNTRENFENQFGVNGQHPTGGGLGGILGGIIGSGH